MKTIVRIVTLSLALGLAGALATAWGAESLVNLITKGEAVAATVKSSKAELDAATQKNNALAAEGKDIEAQQQQLQADIAAYKQKVANVNTETANYKATCNGKQLTQDQYKSCKAQNAQINADIQAVNTQPAKLKKRQDDFISRATNYNQQVKSAPNQVRAADTKYRNALASQVSWLDDARDMVATAAFQPYAKKAGCPDVMKPPKSLDQVTGMSDGILSCLKKVASMN
ncbi:MAG: hypothetical protein WBR15_10270 [Gammaproteobacteria bacterium]